MESFLVGVICSIASFAIGLIVKHIIDEKIIHQFIIEHIKIENEVELKDTEINQLTQQVQTLQTMLAVEGVKQKIINSMFNSDED